MRLVLLLALVALAAAEPTLRHVKSTSQFEVEPEYFVEDGTKEELVFQQPAFVEMATDLDENDAQIRAPSMSPVKTESQFRREPLYTAAEYEAPTLVEELETVAPQINKRKMPKFPQYPGFAPYQGVPMMRMPYDDQTIPYDGIDGAPGYTLVQGPSYQPGNYFAPILNYRFPSYPNDYPTFGPPSMVPVPLPPPWRSDPLAMHSDGARYAENMAHYDYYGPPQGQRGQQMPGQQMQMPPPMM